MADRFYVVGDDQEEEYEEGNPSYGFISDSQTTPGDQYLKRSGPIMPQHYYNQMHARPEMPHPAIAHSNSVYHTRRTYQTPSSLPNVALGEPRLSHVAQLGGFPQLSQMRRHQPYLVKRPGSLPVSVQNISSAGPSRQSSSSLNPALEEPVEVINVSMPMLDHIGPICDEKDVDIRKLGNVLSQYSKKSNFHAEYSLVVEEVCESLGFLDPSCSSKGQNIPAELFNIAMTFVSNCQTQCYKNLRLSMKQTSTEKSTKNLFMKPIFSKTVINSFSLSVPLFKSEVTLDVLDRSIPSKGDTMRVLTSCLRYWLDKIFIEKEHVRFFSARVHPKLTRKRYLDFPVAVTEQLTDAAFNTFQLCASILKPEYRFSVFSLKNPKLCARLGATEEVRKNNFEKLKKDAVIWNDVVFDKIQRIVQSRHSQKIVMNNDQEVWVEMTKEEKSSFEQTFDEKVDILRQMMENPGQK